MPKSLKTSVLAKLRKGGVRFGNGRFTRDGKYIHHDEAYKVYKFGQARVKGWGGLPSNKIRQCTVKKSVKGIYTDLKNPIQIGDSFKIMLGSHYPNYENKRFIANTLRQKAGASNLHAWIEITSSSGCKHTYGLGADFESMWKAGSKAVIRSSDFLIIKCRQKVKECKDAQKLRNDYVIPNHSGNPIVVNWGDEGGCRVVCGGIQSIDDRHDETNNYYPNFMVAKEGKIKHVHVRILDWFYKEVADLKTYRYKIWVVWFNRIYKTLEIRVRGAHTFGVLLKTLGNEFNWEETGKEGSIAYNIIEQVHKLFIEDQSQYPEDWTELGERHGDPELYSPKTVRRKIGIVRSMGESDLESDLDLMVSIPIRYLGVASVFGVGTLLQRKEKLKGWLKNDITDLANCQTFASDFHSNPTYIFKKLYKGEYDARVKREMSDVEKKIARHRWGKLRSKLLTVAAMQRIKNDIEVVDAEIAKTTQKKDEATAPGKKIHGRAIKELNAKKKKLQAALNKIQKAESKINTIPSVIDASNMMTLLEERKVLSGLV